MKTFERGFVVIVVLIAIYFSTNFGSNAEDESALGKPRRTRAPNDTNVTKGCTLNGTWRIADRNVFYLIDKCNKCRCIAIDVEDHDYDLANGRLECTHRNCDHPDVKVYNANRTTVPPTNVPPTKEIPATAGTTAKPQQKG